MLRAAFRFALFWIVTFGLLLGLWFLYTDSLNVPELLVGAGAAVLASTGAAVVEGQRFAQFSPKPQWLLLFLTEPWYALTDSAAILWALMKRIAGRKSDAQFKVVRLDAGGDDNESAARRALAIALTTIPPNSIVIGIDRRRNLMLIHQVLPTGTPWVTRQVGAHE
jgi:multisubunit Na+/H+ antiporter MnhE subunit